MGFFTHGGTPKWMADKVYEGKTHLEMDDLGYLHFGNPHIRPMFQGNVPTETWPKRFQYDDL